VDDDEEHGMVDPIGFFTDTTVCIGCKACEVARKEWKQLPATEGGQNTLSGQSYANTRRLDGTHWQHVNLVEQIPEDRQDGRWLLMSYVCKHCVPAGCLEVCPTSAIWLGRWGVLLAITVLVLAGGWLLRTVIVFSQRGIEPWIASY
jgi:Fe-S-cluster-containing dehydrogenase component